MDISIVIVLWVIVTIVQSINDRKKTPPPPAPPQGSDFEIPTLANDPNQYEEIEEINLEEIYRQRKQAEKNKSAAEVQSSETFETEIEKPKIKLTPENAMSAIIFSEILGKPKALRKKF